MAEITIVAPSEKFNAVTPSDTALLTYNGGLMRTKALYIGGVGDIAVVNDAGTSIVFQNVPAGSVIPVNVNRVMSTSTTATLIVAMF